MEYHGGLHEDVTAINNLSLRGSYGLTATAGPATNSLRFTEASLQIV
jgi:hypothetical protein